MFFKNEFKILFMVLDIREKAQEKFKQILMITSISKFCLWMKISLMYRIYLQSKQD